APPGGRAAVIGSERELLRNAEGVIDLDPEGADGAFGLRVSEEKLNRLRRNWSSRRDRGEADCRKGPRSGNAEQLARAAGSLGVVFYKVPGPTPDEYTFAHNAIMTLVGPDGSILTRLSSDALVDDFARALRRLIDLAGS